MLFHDRARVLGVRDPNAGVPGNGLNGLNGPNSPNQNPNQNLNPHSGVKKFNSHCQSGGVVFELGQKKKPPLSERFLGHEKIKQNKQTLFGSQKRLGLN